MTYNAFEQKENEINNYINIKNKHNNLSTSLLKIFNIEKNNIMSSPYKYCYFYDKQLQEIFGEEKSAFITPSCVFIKDIISKYISRIPDYNELDKFSDQTYFLVGNEEYFISKFDLKNMLNENKTIIISFDKDDTPYFKSKYIKILTKNGVRTKFYATRQELINDLKYLRYYTNMKIEDFNNMSENDWNIPDINYKFVSIKDAINTNWKDIQTNENTILTEFYNTFGISYIDFFEKMKSGKALLYKTEHTGKYTFKSGKITVIIMETNTPILKTYSYNQEQYDLYKQDITFYLNGLTPIKEFN